MPSVFPRAHSEQSHLSSPLASVVLRYSEQAICRDTTVPFCLGLGQQPLPSCEAEWASVLQCTQLRTHTHRHMNIHTVSWPGRTGTSPTASVISFCTGKHWSGLGAQLYYCVCTCVCACVWGPRGLSMIHWGWAVKRSTMHQEKHSCFCSVDLHLRFFLFLSFTLY